MTRLRQFLVLQALMLWQGGFLFYASFVVPAGTRVLGSAEGQGRITAQVTDSLNIVGAVTLAMLLWDLLIHRSRLRTILWLAMAGLQVALFALHAKLDSLMDPDRSFVIQRDAFYSVHRVYLIASTAMWAVALAWTWSALAAWFRPAVHLERNASL